MLNVTCHSIRTNHWKCYQLWMPYRSWWLISVYFINISTGTTCCTSPSGHSNQNHLDMMRSLPYNEYTHTQSITWQIQNIQEHDKVHNWTSPRRLVQFRLVQSRLVSACPISACLGLSWLISSHIILFILPAEYYLLDQPNSPLRYGIA